MASSAVMKLVCAVLVCMVVAAPHAEAAITCGTVASSLAPCMTYLKGGPAPSAACCGGVKRLVSVAGSPADKKAACQCLKSQAGAISGINYGNAAALPGKCGVSIPYKISPSVNCNTIA